MFAQKPVVPKALDHWYRDIASVERLREILEDPTFQLACASLMNAALPSFPNVVSGTGNNEKMCWLGGYSDFARDLKKLTVLPNSRSEMPEWEHLS